MSTTLFVTFALLWSFVGPAFAQPNQVSGIVVDQRTGAPLSGVIVRIGQPPVQVESDANGHFALDLPTGSYELTFSIIGYALVRQSLTIPPGGAAVSLRVELAEGAGPLEEHVDVVGAAPRRRRRGSRRRHHSRARSGSAARCDARRSDAGDARAASGGRYR